MADIIKLIRAHESRWKLPNADIVAVRLESISMDLRFLESHLCRYKGFCETLPKFPVLNRSPRKAGFASLWSDEALFLARRTYEHDIAMFGYAWPDAAVV